MAVNPFVFGRAVEGEFFTDRVEATQRLVANLSHCVSTVLISPRRYGKTSLVKKVRPLLENGSTKTVFLDVFDCKTEKDFYERFATSVIVQTQSKAEEWLRTVRRFLSDITPSLDISVDPASSFKLSLKLHDGEFQPADILDLPQKISQDRGCQIIVMIDEFQQITEFADSVSFQKRLRTVWQHQKNVAYCLFGSKQHLMESLFAGPRCPFFKFGDMMFLQKIASKDWVPFIVGRFAKTGKTISEGQAGRIVQETEGLSSYVQQLAWIVWYKAQVAVQDSDIDDALDDLLDQTGNFFQETVCGLTKNQLNLLRAIASGVTSGLTGKAVIQKYGLVNSCSVLQARDALVKKDLVTVEGRKTSINDPILKLWVLKDLGV